MNQRTCSTVLLQPLYACVHRGASQVVLSGSSSSGQVVTFTLMCMDPSVPFRDACKSAHRCVQMHTRVCRHAQVCADACTPYLTVQIIWCNGAGLSQAFLCAMNGPALPLPRQAMLRVLLLLCTLYSVQYIALCPLLLTGPREVPH